MFDVFPVRHLHNQLMDGLNPSATPERTHRKRVDCRQDIPLIVNSVMAYGVAEQD